MLLTFTKMQGQGNDFVVLNGIADPALRQLDRTQLQRLADRHFGVGCDQILLVEPAPHEGVDFGYRIFNADGGEVEHCGNGARCFAAFVAQQGLTSASEIRVQTMNRILLLKRHADATVTVEMGAPKFAPNDIPFTATSAADCYGLEIGAGEVVEIGTLSMGNPHAVLVVEDSERAAVTTLGPRIEHHPRFPQRVNVGFMQVLARDHIRLRVWERGAGETLACGTGACAAVVIGICRGLLAEEVRVSTHGGDLSVTWRGVSDGRHAPVLLSGAATTVFTGQIVL